MAASDTAAGQENLELAADNIDSQFMFLSELPTTENVWSVSTSSTLPGLEADSHQFVACEYFVDQSLASSALPASPLREIAFVDTQLADYQQIVDDLLANQDETRQIEVVLLDASGDGVAQISHALRDHEGLSVSICLRMV